MQGNSKKIKKNEIVSFCQGTAVVEFVNLWMRVLLLTTGTPWSSLQCGDQPGHGRKINPLASLRSAGRTNLTMQMLSGCSDPKIPETDHG